MKFSSMKWSLPLFFTGCLFVVSCQKDKSDSEPQISEQDAEEHSLETMETDASFDDVMDVVMTAAGEEALASAGKPGTAGKPFPFLLLKLRIGLKATITVTPDDGSYPKTVTVDFGGGDNCPDGRFRKGKIVIHFTAPVTEPGAVVTATLEDFQVGRLKIVGTKVITNLSENGTVKFSVEVKDAAVIWPNGKTHSYEKLKYITQIAGAGTDDILDDVYSIEGAAKSVFKNGLSVVVATEEALIKKVNCLWISDGILSVKARNHEFTLDYAYPADGDCDNKALLTWRGKERIVVLP